MAISKRLRYEILRRDGFACRYCGTTAAENELRVDHVTPVALGGSDDPSNLVASCHPCNSGKSATTPDAPLVAAVEDDALRWAAAMQAGIAKVSADHQAQMAYRGRFETNWNAWKNGGKPVPMDSNWRQGIETFRVRGLPIELLVDATDKAMGAKHIPPDSTYRYMCGIAWKMIEEITASARDAFRGESATKADLEAQTDAAVIDAAVLVWHAWWCQAHGAEPPEDLAAGIRDEVAEVYPELAYPADLFAAVQRAAEVESSAISDFVEDEEDGDDWDRDRYFQVWVEQWRATAEGNIDPDDETQALFRCHVSAAIAASYQPDCIGYAAFQAGLARTARVADFLWSANDVLRSRQKWAERKDSLAAAATELWLVEFATASSGDRPATRDVETFAEHVTSRIGWGDREYVLQAAQQAGAELNYTIDRYLPEKSEVPF